MNIRELLIRIGVSTSGVTGELDKVDNKVQKTKRSFEMLNGAIALVAGAASIRSIFAIGDEMLNLQSQIGNATGDMAGAAAQMDNLSKHADAGRVAVNTYIGSWAKMMSGVKQFGGTADDTTKFMDTLSAAFVSNGTDTNTANAALFQLSQTMQGGQVQGEEMNSLIDAQGELFHDIAVEIGGTVTGYKKMQAAGKVSSEMLLKAVNKFYDKYQGRVEKMPMTVQQAMTKIGNQWKMGIAHMNQATPFISDIASMIISLGDKGAAALGWLVDALGGTNAALQDLKWQVVGFVALFTGAKLIGILTNPFTYVIIAIMAVIAVIQDLVGWINGDAKTAFGELFGDFAQYQHYIDDAKAGWQIMKKDIMDIVGIFRQLVALAKEFDNSDFSKTVAKGIQFAQNPFGGGEDKPSSEPVGFQNSPFKRGWDMLTSSINRATGNEQGAPSRVPDMLAGTLNQPLKNGDVPGTGVQPAPFSIPESVYRPVPVTFPGLPGDVKKPMTSDRMPNRNSVTINNNGNTTASIVVQAQPGQSPEQIGGAVVQKFKEATAPKGGFNPESLLQNAGAK